MLGLASVKFGFIICFRVCKVNQLRVFLSTATTAEKAELAERSGTTLGTLNQVAGGYRRGGQAVVRAGLATRIEARLLSPSDAADEGVGVDRCGGRV